MLVVASSPATRTWFIGSFVPEVIELVLKTWDKFRHNPEVKLEQRLTNLFSDALELAYLEEGKKWFVFPDLKRTHPITGKEIARHDIRFYHRDIQGQKLYFIFECKRLNVQRQQQTIPNASGYTAGMSRFVNGKYSAEHPCGGMIGYVMDGNVRAAAQSTKKRIEKMRKSLHIIQNGEYILSPLMSKHKYNGETKHLRTNGPFVIYHLLLRIKTMVAKSSDPHKQA